MTKKIKEIVTLVAVFTTVAAFGVFSPVTTNDVPKAEALACSYSELGRFQVRNINCQSIRHWQIFAAGSAKQYGNAAVPNTYSHHNYQCALGVNSWGVLVTNPSSSVPVAV